MLAAFAAGVADKPAPRVVLSRALEVGDAIVAALRAHPAVRPRRARRLGAAAGRLGQGPRHRRDRLRPAGAARRARRRSGSSRQASAPENNAARARTHTGIALDLRVVEPDQFGNVLQHLTGSKNHNMALREMVVRRGLHVSEYGVLDDATGETHRCATEEEVYALLGLPWIPPELREDRGELRLQERRRRARPLIEQADLRGDLHMHTVAVRRAQHDRGDGARGARARARVHRDHRPLGLARLRQPRRRPTSCAARSSASARSTRASRASRS